MSENLVICPNCVHQFRAISVSDQERIANLQAENNKLQALNAQLQAENDDIPFRYTEGSSYAGFCQVNKVSLTMQLHSQQGGGVMGRESSELHRMESHIKELQAENAELELQAENADLELQVENAELLEAWNTQGKVLIVRKREITKLRAEVERLKDLIAAENELRPRWAQGYSSDSVAAQCSQAALSEIFKKLGVTNQTEAMQALEEKW